MTDDWDDVKRYFDRAAVVHAATLLRDGAPHSVPVWAGVEGDRLAFFMEEGSLKDRNLQRDPRVAFSVTDPDDPLDMATVRGRSVERIAGADALPVIDRIATAYTGEPYGIRSGMVVHLVEPTRAWAVDYSGS